MLAINVKRGDYSSSRDVYENVRLALTSASFPSLAELSGLNVSEPMSGGVSGRGLFCLSDSVFLLLCQSSLQAEKTL